MKEKRVFRFYTGMWVIAVLGLFVLLWQNVGDARTINYSGLVRGATQKLIKEELCGYTDDALIDYIDGIIENLQTGVGEYNLRKSSGSAYQAQLAELKALWEAIKEEIPLVRSGQSTSEELYALSQQHFILADQMVLSAERDANSKLMWFIIGYFICLFFLICVFIYFNRRTQKTLRKSASTDALTKLLNRTGFELAAAERIHHAPYKKYVIIELDIEDFKMINEMCGYASGDLLLCEVGTAVSNWQGENGLCARIDADDFVLLAEQKQGLINELNNELAEAMKRLDFLMPFGGVKFTLGAYQLKRNNELIKTAMDKANTARKNAKALALNQEIWYDEKLQQKLKQEQQFTDRMHRAIENEEFKMYLQPKVELKGMSVVGAEALVRWEMPKGDIISPMDYIPLFEKNGTIAELDFYMLQKACVFLREEIDKGTPEFIIAVNFSRVTLYQPMFAKRFIEVVDHYSLPHRCIQIEVLESAFNDVSASVLQMLTLLGEDDFSVAMDDFGAGYSNLSQLSRLPIQTVKLDREFLREMENNAKINKIVTCVVDLSHSMSVRVVCEGVETAAHVAFLKEIGCEYAQGFYFSRPIPQDEFLQKFAFGKCVRLSMLNARESRLKERRCNKGRTGRRCDA